MAAAEAMRGTKNILTRPFLCKHEAYIRACDICNIWVEEALCIKASENRHLGAQAKFWLEQQTYCWHEASTLRALQSAALRPSRLPRLRAFFSFLGKSESLS